MKAVNEMIQLQTSSLHSGERFLNTRPFLPLVLKRSFTYVQDWTQVLLNLYVIFGRVIWHFHTTSYLTELCVFWWLFYQWGHFAMLILRSLDLISVQSRTYLRSFSGRYFSSSCLILSNLEGILEVRNNNMRACEESWRKVCGNSFFSDGHARP